MRAATELRPAARREARWSWTLIAAAAALLLAVFYDGVRVMAEWWAGNPEYSHGFALPLVAAFLIWQKRRRLLQERFAGSWAGFAILVAGLALYVAGELSTLYVLVQYGFVVSFLV